jgi:hypothetical protein
MRPSCLGAYAALLAVCAGCASDAARPPALRPFAQTAAFALDPVWQDGRAEKAVYAARLDLYGVSRAYQAVCYTNFEHVDARRAVKSEDGRGLAVLKQHWSERVPTENYDYDYSVSAYLEADGLTPYKLTVGTQEDCGASFKQIWRDHASNDTSGGFVWWESVYFPGAGNRDGSLQPSADFAFTDALPCALRAYPFEAPRELALRLLPTQKNTRATSFEPFDAHVRYAGRETLDTQLGRLDAQRLELVRADGSALATYWMDARTDAPWLHVMLKYRGPGGQTYELQALERTKYWERPAR